MRITSDWIRKGPVPVVTVSWMEEKAVLVGWEPPVKGRRMVRGMVEMPGRDCTPEAYRQALRQVVGNGRRGRIEVYWVIVQEAFPPVLPAEHVAGDFPIKLPDWIRWCWQSLTEGELPKAILSGMAAMERELKQWPEFETPGVGYCLDLEQLNLFIGHGNDESLRRVSRRNRVSGLKREAPRREWLLQTQSLFRNRTKMDLRRVFVAEEGGYSDSWKEGLPFEIIPARKPLRIIRGKELEQEPGMAMLHGSAVAGRRDPACHLGFRSVERRKKVFRWERRLKTLASLLFCGWAFLLVNACRHEALMVPLRNRDEVPVRSARDRLMEHEKRWEQWRRYASRRDRPLHLAGLVAESVPENVEIHRLHMERGEGRAPEGLRLEMEGIFHGEEPSRHFREWIETLRRENTLRRVDNLQFRRDKERIAFLLNGIARDAGTSR